MARNDNLRTRDRLVSLLSRSVDHSISASNGSPVDPDSVHRILVVKPCCFGDVLMATPALRALKRKFPDASIDVLTTEWCAEALRNNPDVNGVFRYPSKLSIGPFMRLVQRVREEHYDVGVGLDRSPFVNLLLDLGRIPVRAGIDSSGRGIGLTHRAATKPGQHETELYLSVVAGIGAVQDDPRPVYRVLDSARAEVDELIGNARDPIVVIHPGGAVNPGSTFLSKRWPAEYFGALASELVQRLGASIVVVGAESDLDAVQGTVDMTDATVTNLANRLTIPQLAAVCERARLYVGNDSGMSHLASAVGTPTVTIFGPTSPAMYRPLGPDAIFCAPSRRSTGTAADDLRDGHVRNHLDQSISDVPVETVLAACESAMAVSHRQTRS